MDPDSFISGNFYLIRLFIFCYIWTVKNTVRKCSQFIQNKEQNVNYSVLYRNYLFDTRHVIWLVSRNNPWLPNFYDIVKEEYMKPVHKLILHVRDTLNQNLH